MPVWYSVMVFLCEPWLKFCACTCQKILLDTLSQIIMGFLCFAVVHYWDLSTFTCFQLNQTSNLIMEEDLSTMLSESGCPSVQHCFLYFTTSSSDGQYHSENWLLLSNFTDAIGLSVPKIKVRYCTCPFTNFVLSFTLLWDFYQDCSSSLQVDGFSMTDQGFRFTLTSDVIAPFVWLEVEGVKGHFSSNGFLLGVNSGAAKTVEFISKQKIGLSEFSKALCVKSLMNVYESWNTVNSWS